MFTEMYELGGSWTERDRLNILFGFFFLSTRDGERKFDFSFPSLELHFKTPGK